MQKQNSKSRTSVKPVENSKTPTSRFKQGFNSTFVKKRDKIWIKKSSRRRLHTSFRRSYREDSSHSLPVPGLVEHTVATFKMLFKNWKTFGLLLLLALVFNIVLVGLFSEGTYVEFQETLDETSDDLGEGDLTAVAKASLLLISTVTTGGLNNEMTEVQQVFLILIFLTIWLVVIYLLRHFIAGNKIKLRDALFNSLSPLLSTFCVFVVIFIEMIPIFLLIIAYAAAISTNFLATPFYALVFFIFAATMCLISGYLLSSSLIALVAVSAPGLYPITALRSASNIMAGNRIKFIIRIIYLIIVLAVLWVLVLLPIILLDLWLKSSLDWLAGVPIVPFFFLTMTCFSFIFVAAYFYLFYRKLLAAEEAFVAAETPVKPLIKAQSKTPQKKAKKEKRHAR